ncbi:2OG-Fe(II) oxygenase [Streptomyces sp. NBC_00654]|uniref:2OG-Fe(II) oxygenase family protein n=1 Tax=Streptomyces sp. NBC_00654 TaxID=2975799 RepID=UPI00225AE90A|nr:2OG-Fe(II) oxygenase [Streptomyces sp. NBC_00654]MCX4967273.1 2OG-Fe(II) oxygenase [Streptomyces sp. NBC_00654]
MSTNRELLIQDSVLMIDGPDGGPYSAEEIDRLVGLCEKLPRDVGIGDNNSVEVGRIVVDSFDIAVSESRSVPHEVAAPHIAEKILEIIAKSEAMAYWGELCGHKVSVRRAQANYMQQGQYIGRHTDSESNPEYCANVVIGLSDDYTGGEFVAHMDNEQSRRFILRRGSILVGTNDLLHEVSEVSSGVRGSLVMFLVPEGQ